MSDTRVGLGYAGCAKWGRSLAAPVARSEAVRIVSGWSRRVEPRERFAKDFDCEPCESYEKMLADPRVEGVVIATPNDIHCQNAIQAAEAGKHVFVEKPITNRIDEALRIIEACREHKVLLAVGHNTRRGASYRKMKELVAAGTAGTVTMAEANTSHNGGLGLAADAWRADEARCPALPLMQLGVHHADTLRYLLGRIEAVSSMMTRRAIQVGDVDTTVQLLRFAGGELGYLGSNYISPGTNYIRLLGTDAVIYAEGGRAEVTIVRPDGRREILPVEAGNPNCEEIEEFGKAIRGTAQVEVDGEAGTENLAVVLAAIRSSKERREVTVDEILEAGRRGEL
jgi:predicted dehydrogenase